MMRLAAASVSIVLALVLTGCGDDGDSSDPAAPPTNPTTTQAVSPSPSATSPRPTATAASPAPTRGKVKVALQIAGCDDCTLTAFTTQGAVTKQLGSQKVTSGRTTWSLTPKQTRGLAFTVSTPQGYGSSNAAAVLVWQYQGVAAGSTITDTTAAAAARGTWCWAGTSRADVTIPVTVTRFPDKVLGTASKSLRVYANPMAQGRPPFVDTYRGGLGVQDDPSCPS